MPPVSRNRERSRQQKHTVIKSKILEATWSHQMSSRISFEIKAANHIPASRKE
jgi:hypothetical protein